MAGTPYTAQPGGFGPPSPNPNYEKPTAAFILSLIGGIFILLWGALIADAGLIAQSETYGISGGGAVAIGVVEALLGLLVIVFGVLLYVMPQSHVVFGILVLVFSIVSLVGLGGLIIGFILGLIGGILGISHKPTPIGPTVVYVQPQRMCPKCGRAVAPDVRFCSYCGNALP